MLVEQRLKDLDLVLPEELEPPKGVEIPFRWVRLHGNRAFVSGHGALASDGAVAGPFGKVPSEVSLPLAQESARLATLAILASLKRSLGELDRVSAWLTVNGFVNADPGYAKTTLVMNPCSELIVSLFGPTIGDHARTAIGVSTVPLNLPVVIAAEVEVTPDRPVE